MLSIGEIDEYSKRLGYTRGQTEKDYMQYHALLFIGRTTGNQLVFKGGTCLQKVFGLDRFSEDLDFTLAEGPDDGPNLEGLAGHFGALGYPARLRPAARGGGKDSFRMLIEGPLFDGGPLSRCSMTINISSRGDLVKAAVAKRLVPPYAEIPPLIVRHLDVLEILAEKVRALMTREKARDLYDLHFLLKKGVRPDRSLVESKLSFYDVRLNRTGIRKSIASKKKIWKNELTPLLPSGPMDFVTVSREVREGMDALFVR
jgi:hypothetical protein